MNSNPEESGDRLVAALAYLYVPGWLIALLLNSRKRTDLVSYHLRQSVGLILVVMLLFWIIRVRWVVIIGYLAMLAVGAGSALAGQQKPLPGFGRLFQDWFRSL